MFDCSTTTYVWIDGQSCSMESRRVSLTSISLADARFTTRSANGCRISTWASWSTTWECPTSILNSWPTFPMAGRSARASCIATFCRWRAWPCSSSPRWWRNAKDSFSMFHPLQPSFQHRSSPCIPALRWISSSMNSIKAAQTVIIPNQVVPFNDIWCTWQVIDVARRTLL